MGHRGIVLTHLCFDGALHSRLCRRFKQWPLNESMGRVPLVRAEGHDAKDLYLKEWCVCTQCTCHAAHNPVSCAMRASYPTVDNLGALWQLFTTV